MTGNDEVRIAAVLHNAVQVVPSSPEADDEREHDRAVRTDEVQATLIAREVVHAESDS